MTRIAILLVTLTALMLAASRNCLACDCLTLTARQSFEAADTVFFGTVIRAEAAGSSLKYSFKVDEVVKGPPADEVVITSAMSNCDYTFVLGGTYFVYATRFQSGLIVSACTATKGLGGTLGQARSLSDDGPVARPGRLSYREVAGVAALLVLAMAIGFLLLKSRRHAA